MVFPPQGGEGDKKKKGGEEEYYKYEREEVGRYRDRVIFVLPDAPLPPTKPTGIGGPVKGKSLNYLFAGGNKVYVDRDPRLDELVNRHKSLVGGKNTAQGFRIQIFAGTGYEGSERSMARANTFFPDMASYRTFKSPNYVVRIGDFLEREEAILFLRKAREHFAGAFIVPEKVKIPKYDLNKD